MTDLDYCDARVKAKKIPIEPCKRFAAGHVEAVDWTRAPAFAVNPRGILVHRVRHVATIIYGGKGHHHHVTYLCGNGCNVAEDAIADVLVADPPDGRFLCAVCEAKAARLELPSGDKLAGRHVHRGVLVAQQVCCTGGHS